MVRSVDDTNLDDETDAVCALRSAAPFTALLVSDNRGICLMTQIHT